MHTPSVVTAVALTAAVAGCGGNSNTTASTPTTPSTSPATPSTTSAAPASTTGAAPTRALTIGETQYRFTPSSPTISQAGTVTVTARNDGSIVHALEIEGAGPGGRDVRTAAIQPGSAASLRVTLKPGTYQIYCPIDGHRALGLKGKIVVAGGGAKPAAGATSTTSTTPTTSTPQGGSGY
jgi:uncharacterized cupredoxin-like copper-binding protein